MPTIRGSHDCTSWLPRIVGNRSRLGTCFVQFVYIGRPTFDSDCYELNRTELLTPNDTFSVTVSAHNPSHLEGFLYAVAQSPNGLGQSIGFNQLLGTITVIDGLHQDSYELEALTYYASVSEGSATDLDADGLRDLDGVEYAQVADQVLIPRFMGQSPVQSSELILINLTLTLRAIASVEMQIYNDNEEVFSVLQSFQCWQRVLLTDISGVFNNKFLGTFTSHDPNEVVGAPELETGWIRLQGSSAVTSTSVVQDPAILAVLIERPSGAGTDAALPFELGQRSTGSLIQYGKSPFARGSQ